MEISPLARRSFSQKKRILICLLVGPVARPLEIIAKVLLLSCSIVSDFTEILWHLSIFNTLIAGVAPSLAATNSDSALDFVLIGCLVDTA